MNKKLLSILFAVIFSICIVLPSSTNAAVECYNSGTWSITLSHNPEAGTKDYSELQAICKGNLVASGSLKATSTSPNGGSVTVTVSVMQEKFGFDTTVKEQDIKLTLNGSAKNFTINAGDVPLGNYYIKVKIGENEQEITILGSGNFKLK